MIKFLTTAVETQEAAAETETLVLDPINIDDLQDLSNIDKFLSDVWENIVSFLPTLIFAIVVLAAGIIFSNSILRLINKAMLKNPAASTISGFIQSLVKIVLYVLFFTIALTIIGIPSTSIFAVIGSAGVAVALALQDSLSNIAGGFIVIITKPFKVGDYIECSKVSGTISKIDIYYTTVTTIDNKKVYVPNGELSKETVTNFSENAERLVEYKFSVAYNSDLETAKMLIKKVIHESDLFLPEREPLVQVSDYQESSVVILTRAAVRTENYWNAYYYLLEEVRKNFYKYGITIPFNQLDVHIVNNEDKNQADAVENR